MGTSLFQRAFVAGELAPALTARADIPKYLQGLRTCRNFVVMRHGGVTNRAGFRFVNGTKTDTPGTFLLRYVSEVPTESVLIEAGPNYLRFYRGGALVTVSGLAAWSGAVAYGIGDLVVSGGVNYYARVAHTNHVPPNATYWYPMPANVLEVPTPFNDGFDWSQSGTTLTLTSLLVKPWELICVAPTRWVIRPVATAPSVLAPTGLMVTGGAAGTLSYQYLVTAASPEYEESVAGAITQVTNILAPTPAAPNLLTWTPVVGAPEYYIYLDPFGNGTFGYIGVATGQANFQDTGLLPDFAVTPPQPRILFATAGNYPASSATYQQRRFFARTMLEPDSVWGSRTGFPSNFNISSPLQPDDALTFRLAANEHNPVRWLVGLKTLVVLTDGGEWVVSGGAAGLSPASLDADQNGYVGVADVRPVVIGNAILYVQARGSIVRDLQYDIQVEGLAGRDLTIYAAHLFDGFTIAQLDYALTPHSIAWGVRSDGTLLGLTYVREVGTSYLKEQEVLAWHRHDTGAHGRFEAVCVVPEPGEDVVYVIVRRTIGGVFKRYIEKLERRIIQNYAADVFFVDAGLSYSGAPASHIAGLDHLEGEVIAVVGDGTVVFNGDPADARAAAFTVHGGAVALPAAYSIIHAGLPIRFAEIETLDIDVNGVAVRDKKKRIGSLQLLVDVSARTLVAGPSAAQLTALQLEPWETNPSAPFSGLVELNVESQYDAYGRTFIRQVDPLPLTVLGVLPNTELGG